MPGMRPRLDLRRATLRRLALEQAVNWRGSYSKPFTMENEMAIHVDVGQAVKSRVAFAGQIAIEQKQHAETLLLELGVGGKHPDREKLMLAAMLVIATNYSALEKRN